LPQSHGNKYVQQAFDNGYTIVHRGLLCWSPIPAAAMRFPVRVLYIIIEAIFSIGFWAMKTQTKAYGMPRLSPWSAEDVKYDGCCNHSALFEGISGEEEGLTLEQIAANEVEMDQKRLV